MAKLLSVGEMVIDFLPGSEEASYIRKAGGAPANVAIAVSRQGCDAAFCGMMGIGNTATLSINKKGDRYANEDCDGQSFYDALHGIFTD